MCNAVRCVGDVGPPRKDHAALLVAARARRGPGWSLEAEAEAEMVHDARPVSSVSSVRPASPWARGPCYRLRWLVADGCSQCSQLPVAVTPSS
jgi:hypothetical protein